MAVNYDLINQMQLNLDRHFEFVRYMESKSAALLAASTGLLAVSVSALLSDDYAAYALFTGNVALFSLISVTLLSVAFIPFDIRPRRYNNFVSINRNVFYFGDTATMTPKEVASVIEGANAADEFSNDLVTMLSDQIVINAKICVRKALLMRWAVLGLIAAVATPVAAGFIWISVFAARERFQESGEL